MQNTNEYKREELQGKLIELEEKQEELEYHAKQVFQEEEEEDFEMSCTYTALERMRGSSSLEDHVIQQIIDEQQNTLMEFRKKKMEFEDEFRREIRIKRQNIEMDREELKGQITRIKNGEENTETEEKNK